MNEEVRWKQRFANYQKALQQLTKFIDKGELNELEEQGLIQAFEYTHELAWNVLRDYLIGKVLLYGSRAKGTYRNGSDIDLTLLGDKLTYSLLNRIETEIDDLLLPYTVDLSLYSHIDNADLLDHIQRVGKLFFQHESGENG